MRAARERLRSAVGADRIATNSSHHQAIARAAPGIRVVGVTPDGVIEAVESTDADWWMVGVQWHPEELIDGAEDWDRRIFSAFRDEVRRLYRCDEGAP